MKKTAIALITLIAIAAGLWLLVKPHPREIAAKEAIFDEMAPGLIEFTEIKLKPTGAVCGVYRPVGAVDRNESRVFAFAEDGKLHVLANAEPSQVKQLSKEEVERLLPSEVVERQFQLMREQARHAELQRTITAISELCGFDL